MTFILVTLIVALVGGIVSVFANDAMLNALYFMVFDSGQFFADATGVNFFSILMPVTYGVGISLIILKFLKKMFDVYVLWTDGDGKIGNTVFQSVHTVSLLQSVMK